MINTLKLVGKNQQISYYRMAHDYPENIRSYMISTPYSRQILNQPGIYGCEFTTALQKTITMAIKYFPEQEVICGLDPLSISVIHFLRSGLNFGIRDALNDACGFNTHLSSFLTSQRDRNQYGRWYIRDDQYQKLELPNKSSLFIGEIVATGVTVQNGFDIIFRRAKNLGHPIKNIFFFTIGCHKIEKTLRKYDQLLRAAFPEYENTYLIYLEGKFHLADSKTMVSIKIQGTDLLRHPALLTPEFEKTQFQNPAYPLERCVIYDGGARAFNVPEYIEDLRSYWEKMLIKAEQGQTLEEALNERWPAEEYKLPFNKFITAKKRNWNGVKPEVLKQLYLTCQKRWSKDFKKRAKTSQSLVNLCFRRLRALHP